MAPHTLAAMTKVHAACVKNNLIAGAFAGKPEIIKEYIGLGFTFIAAITDNDVLRTGIKAGVPA
jgi:2-keto-3-deoxy-L-rhamnonate aldolase RhmA